ncbi:hypothetical protein Dsin_025087 [Dipteronia sinensis]|uniref:F-box domain-containing protein n=1 Tax=Dipteronia sinensis TaxID=43782 RepID=A0AAD9ZV68_9ROSI|nr:hypothetical protein Dsin_025087 [Dipteronia sinensis]
MERDNGETVEQATKKGTEMMDLPEGCIATIISFTSARDACRLSCVNSLFKSVADSNVVWDHFCPDYYKCLISKSYSMKELFVHRPPDLFIERVNSFVISSFVNYYGASGSTWPLFSKQRHLTHNYHYVRIYNIKFFSSNKIKQEVAIDYIPIAISCT